MSASVLLQKWKGISTIATSRHNSFGLCGSCRDLARCLWQRMPGKILKECVKHLEHMGSLLMISAVFLCHLLVSRRINAVTGNTCATRHAAMEPCQLKANVWSLGEGSIDGLAWRVAVVQQVYQSAPSIMLFETPFLQGVAMSLTCPGQPKIPGAVSAHSCAFRPED